MMDARAYAEMLGECEKALRVAGENPYATYETQFGAMVDALPSALRNLIAAAKHSRMDHRYALLIVASTALAAAVAMDLSDGNTEPEPDPPKPAARKR